MTESQKAWIDGASYEMLLRRWRFSPAGDLIFQGEAGEYFAKVLAEKRAATGDDGVAASKGLTLQTLLSFLIR